MSRAVEIPVQFSLAVLAALGGVVRAAPLVLRAGEPNRSASFQCPVSAVHDLDKCFGPENGGCPNSSKCFMRETYRTKRFIASCCCDKASTPVEEVEKERWSCWVESKSSEAALQGQPPFCDILCCKRSRACHGNGPICCDERVSRCGTDTSGAACCAPLPGSGVRDPHCSPAWGHTCGWVRTSWLTLLMPSGRCLVGSQARCQERCELLSRELLVTISGTLMAFCTLCSWGERRVTATCRALRHVLALLIAVGLVLLSARWAGHAWPMCLLWAAFWLVLALLPALLWHRSRLCPWPRQRQQQQLQLQHLGGRHGQSLQNRGVSLAILVNLEDYELWPPLEGGESIMEELKTQLTERGWTVPPVYRNLNRQGFDSLVRYVGEIIEDSTDAHVLIFISCHSQMVFGIPQVLPVEAGNFCWWRGVSIYQFMQQLGRVEATKPHFAIFVNGCLESVSCWQELCWRLAFRTRARTVQLSDPLVPTSDEAVFSILLACTPRDQGRGDWLLRRMLDFLANPSNSDAHLQQLFEYVQGGQQGSECVQAGQHGWAQHPWTMTRACGRFSLAARSSRPNSQSLPSSLGTTGSQPPLEEDTRAANATERSGSEVVMDDRQQ